MRYSKNTKILSVSVLALLILFMFHDLSAQLKINELMADNQMTIADPDQGDFGDWIEILNLGNTSIDLTGYGLSDDSEDLKKWVFPNGTIIPGNTFMLIWADNDNVGLHTNFRLSRSGETLILTDAQSVVLDSIAFAEQIEDVSYGRLNDGGTEWVFFSRPSPGSTNSGGSSELVAAPAKFSHESGFYEGKQTVSLTAQSPGAKIYYTLDGSNPSQSSSIYVNPVVLDTTSVLRCIQLEQGYLPSPVITKTYLIDESTTLPVFSIVTDPENLWSQDSGIYVEGKDYVWAWFAGNFWQPWERECFVEFWESNRKQKISQGAGLRISGALTRTASQKALRIIARSEYGKKKFSYKFFKNKDISSFNEIVLRGSGNDWAGTMMADGMMATIVSGQMDIDYGSYRPAILFLNGVYWGIHNIREKIGDDFIKENHYVDKDNIDLLSQIDDPREGDFIAYHELLDFINSNSMTNASNYEYVESKIDIPEYINYYVTQIYYSNHDWPAGNIKYWRTRDEYGIWRWILFDTDLAFKNFSANTMTWVTNPLPDQPGARVLFNGLIENEKFQKLFLDTYQYHMATTFSTDRLIGIIDSLQSAIQPEIARHIDRWQGYHGWTWTSADGTIESITPGLESYEDWEANVEGFRNYARKRPGFLNSFVSTYFGYGSKTIELTLDIDPPGSGRIWVNGEKGSAEKLKMVVFENQQISFQAIGNLNTDFQYWNEKVGSYEEGDEIQLIPKSSVWKYLDNGVFPGSNWTAKNFNDSDWGSGPGLLGYNDLNAQTIISFGSDPASKHITYWFRHSFEVPANAVWKSLVLNLKRDDGAIVYLNGQEIVRSNMPAVSDQYTLAESGVDEEDEGTYFEYAINKDYLISGVNTLAVEVHQVTASSSDLSFDLGMTGTVAASAGFSTTYQDLVLNNSFTENTSLTALFGSLSQDLHLSINEIMSANSGAYITEIGKTPDWVEIYNPNDRIVDVGGLYITDNLLIPDKWRIPSNEPKLTSIDAKGYLVLLADQRTSLGADHIDIQFSSQGEEVGLYRFSNNEFVLIDSLFFPAIPQNTSFGRYTDGEDDWRNFIATVTPGSENKVIEDVIPNTPLYLFRNFPNPFSQSTTIRFNLKDDAPIRLIVRDLNGQLIKVLTDVNYTAGLHSVKWDGTNEQSRTVPPGMYFYTIFSNYYTDTYRIVKLNQ